MFDQIKITVKYFRLKKYLMDQLHYSKKSAVITIHDIRKMEPVIRKAFLVWFTTGEKPEGELCGIHYNNLLTYRKLNPVSAFLAIDWYVKEPEAAYAAIATPMKDNGKFVAYETDKVRQIAEMLDCNAEETEENTEDITE